uniref:Formylglycine-generating enzyme, required for sulfatase activity, contains SUMF1/FGE domain n=1 Tax=uncultured Thiotrichaceae bacterium TaxID=298394 RepID=A0A6S6UDQ6_9GAMM|nr:MAG: Formylglycine-generating enzyme, required for sulfatase activity, contains SUMF1/FGE domain [uncultured Thiotrichaceae bacterium]
MPEPYNRQHKTYPDNFPESWASGWGEDEYGLWMAFTYKGARQQFRWCEPGTFMMGSPESEAERLGNEAQHEVTLSKGFWIADTTVTQALWEAVMGENPSRFEGENRPVDSISWDDSQDFIGKMNGMKPELKLCLPSEAQWEYACRAGSITPFCWGEQINSDLVNFDGSRPYNNGRVSEYREETVDVQSFYQNNWGLWQMHGNVLEWCHDWFGDYQVESVVDPSGSDTGGFRVLRGGSWIDIGRFCRSAYRSDDDPSSRVINVGFRLALGL